MTRAILIAAVINAAAGAVVGLSRMQRPRPPFWDDLEWVVILATLTVSLFPLLQTVISERGDRKRRREVELENTLHPILASTLIVLSDTARADWKKTGVQVFRVRPWWVFRKKQVRAGRLRMTHIQPSGITWSRDKGLIGRCWKTGNPVSANLDTHFAPYRHLSESEWKALPLSVDRYGLTFDEFRKIGNKYGLVVAFPLTSGDEYIGCITADMPPECSAEVDEAKVRETLSAAAPSISAVIEKKS